MCRIKIPVVRIRISQDAKEGWKTGWSNITGLSRKWNKPEYKQMHNQCGLVFQNGSCILKSGYLLVWHFCENSKIIRVKTWHTVISGKPTIKLTRRRKYSKSSWPKACRLKGHSGLHSQQTVNVPVLLIESYRKITHGISGNVLI